MGVVSAFPVSRDIRINPMEVDWGLFGQVLPAGISILNDITRFVFSLITVDEYNIYPEFDNHRIEDSEYVG